MRQYTLSFAVVAVVNTGSGPLYFAYDPEIHDMYVTTNSGISVISPSNIVLKTITDNDEPSGIIYDPANSYVYVANAGTIQS